jgi:Glutamine amidotransferase domain
VCGISGAFAFSSSAAPINQAIVLRLNDLQRRRGPDGAGLWSSKDDRVVLGHRRLAIIDTGSSGAQPMSDATGRQEAERFCWDPPFLAKAVSLGASGRGGRHFGSHRFQCGQSEAHWAK